MTLKAPIKHEGTEEKIDLDDLERHGKYFIDRERDLIIKANVYTHGTPDSRHVRGEVVCGSDYKIQLVNVDSEAVRTYVQDELDIELADSELEEMVYWYRQTGLDILGNWAEKLGGDRILGRETNGSVGTNVDAPLEGWDYVMDEIVDRASDQNPELSERDIMWKLFNALRHGAPGEEEYQAQIEIVDAERTRPTSPPRW